MAGQHAFRCRSRRVQTAGMQVRARRAACRARKLAAHWLPRLHAGMHGAHRACARTREGAMGKQIARM